MSSYFTGIGQGGSSFTPNKTYDTQTGNATLEEGSWLIPIDSSGGSFVITLPPATKDNNFTFVDVADSCFDNPVTITSGTGFNVTINENGDVKGISYIKSINAWAVITDKESLFAIANGKIVSMAPLQLVANSMLIGAGGDEYSETGDNATNVGANLVQDGEILENGLNYVDLWDGAAQTSNTTPNFTVASSSNGGTLYATWLAFNRVSGDSWVSSNIAGDHWVTVDFGEIKRITRYGWYEVSRHPKSWQLLSSTDGINFDVVVDEVTDGPNSSTYNKVLDAAINVRYLKMNITAKYSSNSTVSIGELYFYDDEPYAVNNTADFPLYSGPSVYFDPADIQVLDAYGQPVHGSGKVNIELNVSGGGFAGSLVDLDTFKAGSPFAATSVVARVQPVGEQTISKVIMTTAAAGLDVGEDGSVSLKVNGTAIAGFTAAGKVYSINGEFGAAGETFTSNGTDWINEGANLTEDPAGVFITSLTISNLSSQVSTATSSIGNFAGSPETNAFDSNLSSYFTTPLGNAAPFDFTIDFGAGNGQIINSMRFSAGEAVSNRNARDFTVQFSDDNVTYEDAVLSVTNAAEITLGGYGPYYSWDNTTAYRYMRVSVSNNNGGNVTSFGELQLLNSSRATTNNTVETANIISGAATIAGATLAVFDETDSEIVGAGKVNVAADVDGAGFGTLVDIASFDTLSSASTSYKLKLQPVGSQKIKYLTIETSQGIWKINSDGSSTFLVNGLSVFNVSQAGKLTTISGEFGAAGETFTATSFVNEGANITFTDPYWENGLVAGADNEVVAAMATVSAGNAADWLDDNPVTTTFVAGIMTMTVDLGAGNEKALNEIQTRQYGAALNGNSAWPIGVQYSTNGSAFVDIVPVANDAFLDQIPTNGTASVYYPFTFTNTTPRRWYRFSFVAYGVITGSSPSSNSAMVDVKFRENSLATTENTIETANIISGAATIAGATLAVFDETDSEIVGAGKVNVAADVDGAGFGTLVDLASFDTLSSASTSYKLKVQPVGSQKIKYLTIMTSQGLVKLNSDGSIDQQINGVSKFKVSQTEVESKVPMKAHSPQVAVTDTTKTLALTDSDTIQNCTNAAAQTISIPLQASVAFLDQISIDFLQLGAGLVTVEGVSGVTVNGVDGGSVTTTGIYRGLTAVRISEDNWVVLS